MRARKSTRASTFRAAGQERETAVAFFLLGIHTLHAGSPDIFEREKMVAGMDNGREEGPLPQALEFARRYLKDKPEADYAEVCTEANRNGLVMMSIVYGKAKKLGRLEKTRICRVPPELPEVAPDLPLNPASPLAKALTAVDSLVTSFKNIEVENETHLDLLAEILVVIEEALGNGHEP